MKKEKKRKKLKRTIEKVPRSTPALTEKWGMMTLVTIKLD